MQHKSLGLQFSTIPSAGVAFGIVPIMPCLRRDFGRPVFIMAQPGHARLGQSQVLTKLGMFPAFLQSTVISLDIK
jgi:hypothetical protein